MHVNRVVRLPLLAVVTLVLSACTLPIGGGQAAETPTSTPTLITPVTVPTTAPPPSETPPSLTPTPTSTEVSPTPVPTTPAGPTSHQVVRGEWIYAIARLYGIDPKDLIAANPGVQGNPDLVFPNQQLSLPGLALPTTTPGPTATIVLGPTTGAPALPLVDRSVYQALLAEALPPLSEACTTAVSPTLSATWELDNVKPRLGCPAAEAISISGSWMEFGPGSRIIWLRELSEFHAINGSGFGQRWVFEDNSGLADAPLLVRPDGSSTAFTPTGGRYGWLLGAHPEISSVFSPAFGDENAILGTYQAFNNGAILFDGALRMVFFDDSGPWWYLAPA